MSEIYDFIKKAIEQKKEAKNAKSFSVFDEAEKNAMKAIETLEKFKREHRNLSAEDEKEINVELADCWGVLGGIYRSWALDIEGADKQKELFKLSYESYEKGYKLEKESGKANSYNMLNRCISQIFYNPRILDTHSKDAEKSDFIGELKRSKQIILSQLNTERKKDVWALADLALIHVLLEEEDPTTAYSRVVDERPLYDTYVSILATLTPLSRLDVPPKESLKTAVRFLEKNLPQ